MPSRISLGTAIAAALIGGAALAPSANGATPDDACAQLTPAQVSATVNVQVGAGAYVSPSFKKTCTWNATNPTPKSTKFVTLMLQGLDGFQAGKTMGQMKSIVVTSVSGVGDDAYYLAVGTQVGLIVKKGSVAFKVAVYADIPLEEKEAMEKTLALQVAAKL